MEDTINNGAIVLYTPKKIPAMLKLFAAPEIKDMQDIEFNQQKHSILIIEYPVISGDLNNKRKNKILYNYFKENKVKYIVEKHLDQNGEYSCDKNNIINEIRAVKLFSAMCKLSQISKKNYMTGSIGFITSTIDMAVTDMFSDEASNMMLYESENLDKKTKTKIYTECMEKKGISIVFSKELDKIIKYSDVLLVDETIDIAKYSSYLKDKIVLGKSQIDGSFCKVEDVLLWNDYIEDLSLNNNIALMNDELLVILRYFNIELSYKEFIKKLNHIYLYNSKEKWNMLYNFR